MTFLSNPTMTFLSNLHFFTLLSLMMSSTSTKPTMPLSDMRSQTEIVERFQEEVYGNINKSERLFPLSLHDNEAGKSKVLIGESSQSMRRYLWTDAFGVLNYVSLAIAYLELGEQENYRRSLKSADTLINSVFAVLGTPSSSKCPMVASLSPNGGYKGLRIGKLKSRGGNSDAGMEFDGMYFHYIDKFLFALCR
jgi:hypothetical protein